MSLFSTLNGMMASGITAKPAWIAVDDKNRIYASDDDGITWNQTITISGNYRSDRLQYLPFNDKFILRGRNKRPLLIDSDGNSSQLSATIVNTDDVGALGSTNSNVHIVVRPASPLTVTGFRFSSDPVNSWSQAGNRNESFGTSGGKEIAWNGSNELIATTFDNFFWRSTTNGASWSKTNSLPNTFSAIGGIGYGNGQWVAPSGDNIYYFSSDGINFSKKTVGGVGAGQGILNVTYSEFHNRWYVTGGVQSTGPIFTTQDPSLGSWTKILSGSIEFSDVRAGRNGTIVAVGQTNSSINFWRSDDGVTFIEVTNIPRSSRPDVLSIAVNWIGVGP